MLMPSEGANSLVKNTPASSDKYGNSLPMKTDPENSVGCVGCSIHDPLGNAARACEEVNWRVDMIWVSTFWVEFVCVDSPSANFVNNWKKEHMDTVCTS